MNIFGGNGQANNYSFSSSSFIPLSSVCPLPIKFHILSQPQVIWLYTSSPPSDVRKKLDIYPVGGSEGMLVKSDKQSSSGSATGNTSSDTNIGDHTA